ncbi:S-formylglutathione hydrolase [Hydra vulgaris]|uniref:S-formylglutathione hydrolase n=1 Tax=Hydra vulgaris TaxID=6087 RepID=UPI0006411916|nr:S-formylglutathione hydrolase [Hydra vulgaris]
MNYNLEEKSSSKCFDGYIKVYTHDSTEVNTKMTFAVYLPPLAESSKCPVLYWISGLTCTEQNFITKSGFQKFASELGIIVVCPDTSPRGANIEGENNSWDFGLGASYYVDATEEKWKKNYRMYSYITKELPDIISNNFPVLKDVQSIIGHSVGGHGALICALKNPVKYKSVSVFAPVSNPINCPWGKKAFTALLGLDQETWKEYDACELGKKYEGPLLNILIDQGSSDSFAKDQLLTENFIKVCNENSLLKVNYRLREGYDHGYYFISTFIEEHIRYHAAALLKSVE